MWVGESRGVRDRGAGEGSTQTAPPNPARPPAAAAAAEGSLRGVGGPLWPRGLPPRAARLVSKQFSILSPHS